MLSRLSSPVGSIFQLQAANNLSPQSNFRTVPRPLKFSVDDTDTLIVCLGSSEDHQGGKEKDLETVVYLRSDMAPATALASESQDCWYLTNKRYPGKLPTEGLSL